MNKQFIFLCAVLIFSVFLQNVLLLPYFGRSIQPTEFIFLLALIFFPYRTVQLRNFSKQELYLFSAIAAYLCINIFSALMSRNTSSVTEATGRVYLFFLCMMIYTFFSRLSREELKQKAASIFFITGSVAAVLSLLGYLLALLHTTEWFVFKITDYPYLGTVYRLRGPAFTPTMIITIMSCCIFFSLANRKNLSIAIPYRYFFIACMLLACILTFSKTILLVAWGLYILYLFNKKTLTKAKLIVSIAAVFLISVIATHYIFIRSGDSVYEKLKATDFISNKKVISFSGITVLESSYLSLKKAALSIGVKNPVTGIGPGNFNDELDSLKVMDIFPVKLPNYDPHSTYMGAFAETGIAGLLFLLLVLWLLVKQYCTFQLLITDRFYLCIFILFILFLTEAISTDIMNFRHFWVLIGVALAYVKAKKNYIFSPAR